MTWPKTIVEWSPIAATVIGAIGSFFALKTYKHSVRLKRGEWLQKLYQQFYEVPRYRTIRQILDYGPERELSRIHAHLNTGSEDDLVDQLWDYLNFFEFIAGLVRLKQIKREDIKLLFEYPLGKIRDDKQIVDKLKPEGYENPDELLRDRKLLVPRAR